NVPAARSPLSGDSRWHELLSSSSSSASAYQTRLQLRQMRRPRCESDSVARSAAVPLPKGAAMTVNTHAPTLRVALLPRTGLLTDALLVCAGAGLIAASAQISFGNPVPITGQTCAVLLVGATLGTARGGAAGLLYVLLGLVTPVYAGHGEGWDVITGASGGYLVSYPFVTALTGFLAERGWDRRFSSAI